VLSVSSIGTNELQRQLSIAPSVKIKAFSFLYRNERTATQVQPTDISAMITFSFLYRNERTATICRHLDRSAAQSFQFPLSERTNCNKQTIHRSCAAVDLSVSSIGTNELQLANNTTAPIIAMIFQFPLSERTNCNKRARVRLPQRSRLSVSSIGTNELQRTAFHQNTLK